MESKLHLRQVKAKIVLLKEMPQTKHLYEMDQLNLVSNPKQKILERNLCKQSLNTSVPHLSSILQDSTDIRQASYQPSQQPTINIETQPAQTVGLVAYKTRYVKHNERYLSELLANCKKNNVRCNTEGVDRLIEERKVMPVDQLRYGRKNIRFSDKNKAQLTRDFSEFVEGKKRSLSMGVVVDQQPRKTAAFVIKRDKPKRKAFSIRTEPIQKMNLDRGSALLTEIQEAESMYRAESEFQEDRSAKLSVQSVATGIQAIKNFRWSKLSKMPFRLAK